MAKAKQIQLTSIILAAVAACFVLSSALRLFGFNLVHSMMVGMIIFAVAVLMVVLHQFYYKEKEFGYSSIGRRFWAFFLDVLLIHLLTHITILITLLAQGKLHSDFQMLYGKWFGSRDLIVMTESFILGVYCVYSMICETLWGGTIGKRTLQMKVYNQQGNKPNLIQALLRNCVKFVVLMPLVIVFTYTYDKRIFSIESLIQLTLLFYLYPKFNKRRSYLQDNISGFYIFDAAFGFRFSEKDKG